VAEEVATLTLSNAWCFRDPAGRQGLISHNAGPPTLAFSTRWRGWQGRNRPKEMLSIPVCRP
jgi:hypothetical protein